MAPQPDPLGRQNSDNSESRQSSRISEHMARSAGIPQRIRNEESWVEISSQPSSSSLSSIGDEIVTTGLRVQHDPNTRRRRRLQPSLPSPIGLDARQTGTSSQEEYEESESEEDHIMTSSNENLIPATRLPTTQEYDAESDSSDDDENATALGRRTEPTFTPQPNAFSHPPSQTTSQRPIAPGSHFPRNSYSSSSYTNRPSNSRAPSNQADHDAALRASLTTLLSIGAAAARGLPKRESSGPITHEPLSLRFVPESELMNPATNTNAPNTSRPLTPSTRARSSPSISSQEAATIDKAKRKAATKPSTGEKARVAKKKKVQVQLVDEALISPTLLTWVMSAGVMVLVSVVGFGAGYVIGREVGRGEGLAGFGVNGSVSEVGNCGREVVRGSSGGLKRFRWSGGVRSIVA